MYLILVGILSSDIVMVRPGPNNPSTHGCPLPATCLLCQMKIPYTFDDGIVKNRDIKSRDESQVLRDREPWKSYWRTSHKHMMLPSALVEEADFGDLPRLWSVFCRASKL